MTSVIPIENLTDSQKDAIYHKEGPLLVLAGPGSGKTRVITCRIAALIESGVRPYHICAITFTNKAAEEMRTRVAESVSVPGAHVSTFHSLCVWILRRYAETAGIQSNFSIFDVKDQQRCIKEAIKDCHVDVTNFTPVRMLDFISRLKNDLESAQQFESRADDFFEKNAAKLRTLFRKPGVRTFAEASFDCIQRGGQSRVMPSTAGNLSPRDFQQNCLAGTGFFDQPLPPAVTTWLWRSRGNAFFKELPDVRFRVL